MRMVIGAVGVLAVATMAGWVAAQPRNLEMRTAASMTFRRAALVRIPESELTRAELTQARVRPSAIALRQSLAQTAPTRVNLAAVDRTRLPVLVSARPALAASLRVFARPDSFSASASEPGMTMVIDGTKTATAAPPTFRMPATRALRLSAATLAIPRGAMVAQPPPSSATAREFRVRPEMVRPPRVAAPPGTGTPPPAAPPTPAPTVQNVLIERTEYGVDVSFMRFGAAYNMSIACDEPDTDPRCSEAGVAAQIAQLEAIGGGARP